jgi:membrane-associated protein
VWVKQLYSQEGLRQLINSGGLLVLLCIVFAETGLLVGFFLPGDSLLVAAGVFLQDMPYWQLGLCLAAAAILGDWVNFWMGAKTGNRVWDRPDGRLFKRRHLIEAQQFYDKYGGAAIALCRFVPIARTFVPFVAGLSRMKFRHFMVWNAVGGSAWVFSMLALGRWLGSVEWLVKHIELIIVIIIAISVVPLAVGVIRRRMRPRQTAATGDDATARSRDGATGQE